MIITIIYAWLAACGAPTQQAQSSETLDLADLPRIGREGTDYPYIRYPETTGQTASRGRAFFLHPIKKAKNELLALEYAPGMKMERLFGEELLGRSGSVVNDNGQIRIGFLPISIPVGVGPDQEWRMQYTKRDFVCKSRAAPSPQGISGNLAVSCTSGKYTLNFQFDRQRGVSEFQDFCDFSICTFRLADSPGLLSRSMTDSMDLPAI